MLVLLNKNIFIGDEYYEKIRAIQTTMTELGDLLKVLTNEGTLIGIEED